MLPTTLSAKKQIGSSFWQIFNERCSHKGVLFDKIDTICGFVNSVSIYLRLYFDRGGLDKANLLDLPLPVISRLLWACENA